MSWSLRCQNLSKVYKLGKQVTAVAAIKNKIKQAFNFSRLQAALDGEITSELALHRTGLTSDEQLADAPEGHFHALKNINLEISTGSRVGIIGSNGSGKSTLLKLLSRITSPSSGFFEFKGRLISLLEVGTGFHPELSGKENIFLNGSIMGMSYREVRRKYNEILEFSEIGKFIDTPVKRYSSGMYVRLAFSVAAHLQSEILIIDEVLSVGDTGFQKKCLDKMLSVSNEEGRTLLFVSHDMDAINKICDQALEMCHGRIIDRTQGDYVTSKHFTPRQVNDVTSRYLGAVRNIRSEIIWDSDETAPNIEKTVYLKRVSVLNENCKPADTFDVKEAITIEIELDVKDDRWPIAVQVYVNDFIGHNILCSMDYSAQPEKITKRERGSYLERCKIYSPLLNEGVYSIGIRIYTHPSDLAEPIILSDTVSFTVTDDMRGGVRGLWQNQWPPYYIRPKLNWLIDKVHHK